MTVRSKLTIAVLAAALGPLIAPAFAQNGSSGMSNPPDHGMIMGQMNRGMMGRGMMSGCADMMQSMNHGGDGRPNSQWHKEPPQSPNNGG